MADTVMCGAQCAACIALIRNHGTDKISFSHIVYILVCLLHRILTIMLGSVEIASEHTICVRACDIGDGSKDAVHTHTHNIVFK